MSHLSEYRQFFKIAGTKGKKIYLIWFKEEVKEKNDYDIHFK